MRPYWKGYLKLALVSCPIALHAACSSAERIAFRQINKVTGNRLRQQLIDEETCEPAAPEHKGRGYEVAKGQHLIVEDAELEAIEIERAPTPSRSTDLCSTPRSTSASSIALIMSCPASRSGRSLCADSRSHARQADGGARAARAPAARPADRAGAIRQGASRHHAA